ncbi:hypothetical protein EON80_25640 [bacterium]|nr:MAG: hypothetical protein EON80_25640 [bacterium]
MTKARRDLALMMSPVIFLGLLGWALRTRQAAQVVANQPFRLQIEKVSFVPVTPREAFDGYDTKVLLTLGHSGPTPAWWNTKSSGQYAEKGARIIAVSGNSKRVLDRVPYVIAPYRSDDGEWQSKIVLKLADVPASVGEVRYQDSLAVINNRGRISPPLAVDFRLRKANESTGVPQVDQRPSCALDKLFVAREPAYANSVRLKIWLRSPESQPWGEVRLIDSHGKLVPQQRFREDFDSNMVGGGPIKVYSGTIDLDPVKTKAASADVIFYDGDKWPLKIPVSLRDEKGALIESLNSGVNCHLERLTRRKPTASERKKYGCDTVVSMLVMSNQSFTGKRFFPHSWEAIECAHLEDELGSQWWEGNLTNSPPTPSWDGNEFQTELMGTGDEKGRDGINVTYFFNMSSIPADAGKVWFKEAIRLDDGQLLPVKILVRP